MLFAVALAISEQTGCFSTAEVYYTRNLKYARVTLTPATDSQCIFADEVQVELIINSAAKSQLFIFDNFSVNTTLITMQNVEITETVIFSYLNISSLSFYTMVRVGRFAEVSTLMDQCIDTSKSTILLRGALYQFNMSLTQACYDEMMSANSYYISFGGFATTIEIDIPNGVECKLDEYDENLLICEHTGEFSQNIQIPFLEVIIIFYMHVRGNDHTVQVTFAKPMLGTYSALYAAENRVTIMQRAVYVYATPESSLAYAMEDSIRSCDKIYARFLAKNTATGDIFQLTAELQGFYVLRTMFVFQCYDYACMDSLAVIKAGGSRYSIAFDVCFFTGEVLTAMVSQYLQVTRGCFETARIYVVGKNQYDINLIRGNQQCTLDLTKDTKVVLRGMRNEIADPVVFQLETSLPAGQTRFSINCSGVQNCDEESFNSGVGIVVRMNQNDVLDYAYVSKCNKANYQTTLIMAFVFGGIFFLGSLYDSISKIVVFQRVIKATKKK